MSKVHSIHVLNNNNSDEICIRNHKQFYANQLVVILSTKNAVPSKMVYRMFSLDLDIFLRLIIFVY